MIKDVEKLKEKIRSHQGRIISKVEVIEIIDEMDEEEGGEDVF